LTLLGGQYELRLDLKASLIKTALFNGVLLEVADLVNMWQLTFLQVVYLLLDVTLILSLTLQHFGYELQLAGKLLDFL
jgi:hypothetical protein